MSSLKLVRLFKKAVAAEGAVVLSCRNRAGHYYAQVKHLDGRIQCLSLSSSPAVIESAVQMSVQRVRQFARAT